MLGAREGAMSLACPGEHVSIRPLSAFSHHTAPWIPRAPVTLSWGMHCVHGALRLNS